jgi:hypothetical protein
MFMFLLLFYLFFYYFLYDFFTVNLFLLFPVAVGDRSLFFVQKKKWSEAKRVGSEACRD